MTKNQKSAALIAQKYLAIQPKDTVIILTDDPYWEIANELYHTLERITKQVYILKINSALFFSNQVAPPVFTLIDQVDIAIGLTNQSLYHTLFMNKALKAGVRYLDMCGMANDVFARICDSDLKTVKRTTLKLCDILTIAKIIKVTSPQGTELVFPVTRSKGFSDIAQDHVPGTLTNIPAGEAMVLPDDGQAEGTIVPDQGLGIFPGDKEKVELTIKNGRATRIIGSEKAKKISRYFSAFGPESRFIAEFGIGTNSYLKRIELLPHDAKIAGMAHIGFGFNINWGGYNGIPMHEDCLIYKPTIIIDGKTIVEKGKLFF